MPDTQHVIHPPLGIIPCVTSDITLPKNVSLWLISLSFRFDSNPDSTDSEEGSDASGSGGEKKKKKKEKKKPKSAKTVVGIN